MHQPPHDACRAEGSVSGMRYRVRSATPEAARELGRVCGVGPTLGQVLLHKGFAEAREAQAFLDPRLADLTAPDGMIDRDRAAERLARAVRREERITVFGDYDVDGTTSAAILAGILESLGGRVQVLVADRFQGGYGLSEPALARVLATDPGILVTCDCGSSDHERIEAARRKGVDVIVVDHHLVPDEPLPALAFLNPQRPDCGFPYKGLASAGLALSLGGAVRRVLDVRMDLRDWLDLVALGTIADAAPLDGDNRRLVRAGLARLSAANARPGVAALRETARIRGGSRVGAMDVSFRLAPRLNAAGRLASQDVTLGLLRARTLSEARSFAARIEQLNERRRQIQRHVVEEAAAQVESVYGPQPQTGVVVASEAWHRGVVGIAAAQLAQRFGVPVVVVGVEDGVGHGSVRAPAGVALYDAVADCADVLERFGGHQAAAGLAVRGDNIEGLRCRFADATRSCATGDVSEPPMADVELDGATFSLPTASQLARLEPLGQGNHEPVFAVPDAHVDRAGVVGGAHLKLALRVGEFRVGAFGPNMAEQQLRRGDRIAVLAGLQPDAWNGGEQVEMRLSRIWV